MATYLCTDVRFRQHHPLGEHPERPERLAAIEQALHDADLISQCQPLSARPATRQEILRVHTEALLLDLEERMGEKRPQGRGWIDPDTYYGPGSYQAALLAAGAAVDLAGHLLGAQKDNGMVLCRPPGHHATASEAMGFCLLNNVAIAAAAAVARGARVAIVDFDVHHGNGTEEIFAGSADVLFISLHQYPFYPGSGASTYAGTGPAKGHIINIPLPAGSGNATYELCFREIVLPALRRFAPDLLLCSAGFDAHLKDPLAGMSLTEEGYGTLGTLLLSVQPRLGAVLEGGYHLLALGQSVAAFVKALLVAGPPPEAGTGADDPIAAEVHETLRSLRKLHRL